MDAGTAALLALDGFGQQKHDTYTVKVSEPMESDTGEFGMPDQLAEESFDNRRDAVEFCLRTGRRGLRAVLYENNVYRREFE